MPRLEQVPSARPRSDKALPAGPQPNAPDAELSEDAVRAIEEGRADHRAGRTFTLAEVKQELGIDS